MPTKVSEEAFVDAWMLAHKEGQNMSWVARTLGYKSRQAVSARAFYLRERGVILPALGRYNNAIRERLNAQIAEKFKKEGD